MKTPPKTKDIISKPGPGDASMPKTNTAPKDVTVKMLDREKLAHHMAKGLN